MPLGAADGVVVVAHGAVVQVRVDAALVVLAAEAVAQIPELCWAVPPAPVLRPLTREDPPALYILLTPGREPSVLRRENPDKVRLPVAYLLAAHKQNRLRGPRL